MDTDRNGQSKRAVGIICHHDGSQARHICTVNREPDAQLLDKMNSSMIVLMFIEHIKTLTKKREKCLLNSFPGRLCSSSTSFALRVFFFLAEKSADLVPVS